MSPLSSSSTFHLHSYLIPIDSLYTAIKSQCQEVFLILFSLQQSGSSLSVSISLPWCKLRLCFFKKQGMLKKSLPLLASYDDPSASAVATDIAVANVITAVA